MPKLKYRFRVQLQNFGVTKPTTEITKQVMNVSRPKISFENIEIHVYNSKVNYAGKHTWDPITLTIRDDNGSNVAKLVGEQLQKQFDFFEQASASSGIDYKFTTVIELLDGGNGAFDPTVLETWECYGCYVQDATYQQADYSSSDPLDIALTIKFDNAIQTDGAGASIGSAVGRTLGTLATG